MRDALTTSTDPRERAELQRRHRGETSARHGGGGGPAPLLLILIYIWVRFGSVRYSTRGDRGADARRARGDRAHRAGGDPLRERGVLRRRRAGLLIEPFKIDLNLVAAILTIIGYSLNDTIVIMDRIRENRGKLSYASAR